MSRGIAIDFRVHVALHFALDLGVDLPYICHRFAIHFRIDKFPPPPAPRYRPQNGPDHYVTREHRRDPYLTEPLDAQIVEILTLRVPYVAALLQNRRNPQLTRSLLISARAKKVVPARLLNLGR